MLRRLKQSLQALAMPAEIQLSLFPDFVCKADELANDFDHWMGCVFSNGEDTLTDAQSATLAAIDAQLAVMSNKTYGIEWTEDELYTRPEWARVRLLAVDALNAFGWEITAPPPSEDTYVPGGRPESS